MEKLLMLAVVGLLPVLLLCLSWGYMARRYRIITGRFENIADCVRSLITDIQQATKSVVLVGENFTFKDIPEPERMHLIAALEVAYGRGVKLIATTLGECPPLLRSFIPANAVEFISLTLGPASSLRIIDGQKLVKSEDSSSILGPFRFVETNHAGGLISTLLQEHGLGWATYPQRYENT